MCGRTLYLFALFLLGLPASMQGQSPQPVAGGEPSFTLADAIHAMESENPALAAARFKTDAATGDAIDAGLWENPLVSYTYIQGLGDDSASAEQDERDFAVIQNIDLFGARRLDRRSLMLERDAVRADYTGVLTSLRIQVERAFVGFAAAAQQTVIAEDALQKFQYAMRIVAARVEAGAEPRYDRNRMALSLAGAEADLAEAQVVERRQRAALDVAVGPGARLLRGRPIFDVTHERAVPEIDALRGIALSRPDLLAARLRLRSSEVAVRAAGRHVWPTPELSLGGSTFPVQGARTFNLQIAFGVPIINHGQGTILAARARAAAAEQSRKVIEVAIAQTLQPAYDVMITRRRAYADFLAKASPRDETLLKEAEAGYVGGLLNILELVDAYTTYRDVRSRLIDLAASARAAELDVIEIVTSTGGFAGASGGG